MFLQAFESVFGSISSIKWVFHLPVTRFMSWGHNFPLLFDVFQRANSFDSAKVFTNPLVVCETLESGGKRCPLFHRADWLINPGELGKIETFIFYSFLLNSLPVITLLHQRFERPVAVATEIQAAVIFFPHGYERIQGNANVAPQLAAFY